MGSKPSRRSVAPPPSPHARPTTTNVPARAPETRTPPVRRTETPAPAPAAAAASAPVTTVGTPTGIGPATDSNICSRSGISRIPEASSSQSATTFLNTIRSVGAGPDRDARVLNEIGCGNIPPSLRNLTPVTTQINGQTVTICVARDYLSVGTEEDSVYTPLGRSAAERAAASMGMMLPTTGMVDSIYQQSDLRLPVRTRTPGAQMTSTSEFTAHSQEVRSILNQRSRAGTGNTPRLIAGHKKDVVTANNRPGRQGHVSIYGWQGENGGRVQSLTDIHEGNYADYSHGIRFISQTAFDASGNPVNLPGLLSTGSSALSASTLAPYRSAAAPLTCDRAPSASPAAAPGGGTGGIVQ